MKDEITYPKRIMANQTHSQLLTSKELMGGKSGLFFWLVESIRFLEEVNTLLLRL